MSSGLNITVVEPGKPLANRLWRLSALSILLVACALLPLVWSVVSSVLADGASSYRELWLSQKGWRLLGRTLELAAAGAVLALLPGLLLAEFCCRLDRRGALLLAALSCLTMLLPSSLLATTAIVALGHNGVLTQRFGLSWSIYSFAGAAGVLALRYFGLAAVLLTFARLNQREEWPVRRAFAIGARAAFGQLYLRPMLWAVLSAFLLVGLFCLNDHVIPDMLLVPTYGGQILIMYSAMMNPSSAAAMAAPVALIGLLLGLLVVRQAAGFLNPLDKPLWPARGGPAWVKLCWAAAAIALLGCMWLIPMGVLLYRLDSAGAPLRQLSAAAPEIARTLADSAIAAAVTTILAAALVHAGLAMRAAAQRSPAGLLLVNLAVPPSLLGIGLILLANSCPPAVRDSTAPLIASYVVRFLPIATLVLFAVWRGQSTLPQQAARLHGLSAWQRLAHVHWPRRRLSLALAGTLCLLLAATEVDMSVLLCPPGGHTLGVRLAMLIHTASDAVVSALCVGILLVLAPLIVLLLVTVGLLRRQERE